MQQQLINLNPDLHQLWIEGYDLEIIGGHLLVHRIPYVTVSKTVRYGTLVCVLTMASPTRTAPPPDHTIYFQGDTPCDAGGNALVAIINNSQQQQLTRALVVNHYFSSRPVSGNYANYYEKIRTYSEILSAQAKALDKHVTSKPNKK